MSKAWEDNHFNFLRAQRTVKELLNLWDALQECVTDPPDGICDFEDSLKEKLRLARKAEEAAKRAREQGDEPNELGIRRCDPDDANDPGIPKF